MKIQVEEYLVEEVDQDEMKELAADGAASLLIDELKLEGQQRLVHVESKTRNPFRRITRVEEAVFKELLPEVTPLAKFDTEILPIRVLELAKKAIDCGQFLFLEVWHSETRKDDPLMVAVVGQPDPKSWDKDYVRRDATYLVVRWGTALVSFVELQREAIKQKLAKDRARLSKEIDELSAKLKRLPEATNAFFLTGHEV